jgi:two-component system, OmpR family, sensor histidine kinase BaeS
MTPPAQQAYSGFPFGRRVPLALRSLTLKLTLAFLLIALTGTLLVSFFVGMGTQRAFSQFVNERQQPTLSAELARFYAANSSWRGVERVFDRGGVRPGPGGHRGPPLLVDAEGRVIVGDERYSVGSQVAPQQLDRARPITLGYQVVGWLVPPSPNDGPPPGSPEADFFARVTRATTYSAIGAMAIALLIGIVLARTLTQPVRELTAATRAMAKGGLGQQVRVHSADELGVLAISFNQMSRDLAHASTLRRQMTADIAHDLRTPLSVILGYTEALRDGKLPCDQEIFDTLHTEAQHLQRLIDDLRTLSLTDAGELPLHRQPMPPQPLLERIAAAYKASAQAQGITLEIQAVADLPAIDIDPERMSQVLGNLLSNALRFTPAGGTIRLRATADGDRVHLIVQDTGTGIAAADLPHIFERFYRADSARQATGSSGLGLAIAKGIVEAHGGTIAVASSEGAGTRFSITLPADRPQRRTGRGA